ncbi:MAG: hypothetical protein H7A24_02605 [Leptospiraceae bacterium]|nr:hypothetical protein [Leptospiraceae bacterium]MCP5510740.1 hypothetical protein [Leptospiraceae bacterium]
MEKCHCSGVRFEKVIEVARQMGIDYKDAARKLDVSETCRACKDDFTSFCERGKTNHSHHHS